MLKVGLNLNYLVLTKISLAKWKYSFKIFMQINFKVYIIILLHAQEITRKW